MSIESSAGAGVLYLPSIRPSFHTPTATTQVTRNRPTTMNPTESSSSDPTAFSGPESISNLSTSNVTSTMTPTTRRDPAVLRLAGRWGKLAASAGAPAQRGRYGVESCGLRRCVRGAAREHEPVETQQSRARLGDTGSTTGFEVAAAPHEGYLMTTEETHDMDVAGHPGS